MTRFALATMAAALAAGLSPARAAFYDVAADYSLASNPNGVWSYGTTPTVGGAFTLYTVPDSNPNGLDGWSVPGGLPAVFKNRTNQVVTTGTPQLQPGQFGLHPGPGGEVSVARFTAPTAGVYLLAAQFTGADLFGTSTDVHVLVNGGSVYDGYVSGFGPAAAQAFNSALNLGAGDTVDFAVGTGGNGYGFDSTALAATLSFGPAAVPEPTSLSLLAAGGLGLAGFARRRANRRTP